MKRKALVTLSGLFLTTITVASLAGCSSNKQASNEPKSSSTKTVNTKHKKKDHKDKNTEQKSSSSNTNQQVSNNASQSTKTQTPSKTASQSNSNQKSAASATASPQSVDVIQSSDQAAALVSHSMGSAQNTMNVKQEADGYHVWFDDGSAHPVVTVVKSNGDFYDVSGKLIGKYSQMSKPTGINN